MGKKEIKRKWKMENPKSVGMNCHVWQDLDPSLKSQSISCLISMSNEESDDSIQNTIYEILSQCG